MGDYVEPTWEELENHIRWQAEQEWLDQNDDGNELMLKLRFIARPVIEIKLCNDWSWEDWQDAQLS